MTYEDAVAYFKTFYQYGPMKFTEVMQVLNYHGWSVKLVKDKGAVWEFTKIKSK